MSQKLKVYVPIILVAVIVIFALILLLSSGRSDSKRESTGIVNEDTTSTQATPDTTTDATTGKVNMPPPVPPEPTVPSSPATPEYSDVSTSGIQCVDTDTGIDYTTKGTVTVTKDGVKSTSTDYCRHGDYEDYLMEFSCGPSGLVSTNRKCVRGCNNNGACW